MTFQETFLFNGTLCTEQITRLSPSPFYNPLRLQGWLTWQLALGWIIHRAWTHNLCDCSYNFLWLELNYQVHCLRDSKNLINLLCTPANGKEGKTKCNPGQKKPWICFAKCVSLTCPFYCTVSIRKSENLFKKGTWFLEDSFTPVHSSCKPVWFISLNQN